MAEGEKTARGFHTINVLRRENLQEKR